MESDKDTEIFHAIADLITQAEFMKNQDEFYKKNQHIFEDTEENKLEYTEIYTEYVYILEEIIEANLKEKYTDEEITEFYFRFADRLDEYKKLNPEVVDQLFGFIDFEEFKKSILLSKNMDDENFKKGERTQADSVKSSFEENKAFFRKVLEEDLKDSSLGWRQAISMKEKDGISQTAYQREAPGRALNIVRGHTIARNSKLDGMYEIFKNFEKYQPMYDPDGYTKKFTMVSNECDEGGNVNSFMTNRFSMGKLSSDRIVFQRTIVEKISPTELFMIVTSEDNETEHPTPDGCVRANIFKMGIYTQEGDDVHFNEAQNFDLNGYFPKSLMNKLQATILLENAKATYTIMNK